MSAIGGGGGMGGPPAPLEPVGGAPGGCPSGTIVVGSTVLGEEDLCWFCSGIEPCEYQARTPYYIDNPFPAIECCNNPFTPCKRLQRRVIYQRSCAVSTSRCGTICKWRSDGSTGAGFQEFIQIIECPDCSDCNCGPGQLAQCVPESSDVWGDEVEGCKLCTDCCLN